jgi:hypothetical protein
MNIEQKCTECVKHRRAVMDAIEVATSLRTCDEAADRKLVALIRAESFHQYIHVLESLGR